MSFPQTPVALAQLITRLLWAYLIVFVVNVELPILIHSFGEPDFTVTVLGGLFGLLLILPLLIFPAIRYIAWLNRVAVQGASDTDLVRVTTWINVFRFLSGLGVAGAVSVGLTSRPLPGALFPFGWWSLALYILSPLATFKLLSVARNWVGTQTATQHDPQQRAAALPQFIPDLTRWIRLLQMLGVLSALEALLHHGWLSVDGLAGIFGPVVTLLILEANLRCHGTNSTPVLGTNWRPIPCVS